jgi:DNA-3-methyladenine glycosylase
MRVRILQPEFFERSTLEVARELLGKYLVLDNGKEKISLMITEVEAYDGPNDLANHASKGRTKRTEVMFQAGGVWYVYLCYGMYWMLNIVTGPKDYPAAILIRGVEGFNGPGKLTKHFKIDKSFNNQAAAKKTKLYIEDRGVIISPKQIKAMPRIGVAYAGPIWSQKKWRFQLIFPIKA